MDKETLEKWQAMVDAWYSPREPVINESLMASYLDEAIKEIRRLNEVIKKQTINTV